MPQSDRMVIYHNPACSKSRAAVALLRARRADVEIVEYLAAPLGEDAVLRLLDQLDAPPAELVRKDRRFEELGLDAGDYTTAEAVAGLIAAHPQLMQRPVVVAGGRAMIARPPEKVEALL